MRRFLLTELICILHTWGQNLCLHPHLHCIVPGGGVDKNGRWKNARADGKFLFPVKGLSRVFRAKYVSKLRAGNIVPRSFTRALFEKDWVVYYKRPFGNTRGVIEYLGRYTHKVAISNHRVKSVGEGKVSFEYKDYRLQGKKKVMTLSTGEFTRRFALHILPGGFVRIRHYGILSGAWKRERLPGLKRQLGMKLLSPDPGESTYLKRCPECKIGTLVTLANIQGASTAGVLFSWSNSRSPLKKWVGEVVHSREQIDSETRYWLFNHCHENKNNPRSTSFTL